MALRWVEGFEFRNTDVQMADTYDLVGNTNYSFATGRYGGICINIANPQGFSTPSLGSNATWIVGLNARFLRPEDNVGPVRLVSFQDTLGNDQVSFCMEGNIDGLDTDYVITVHTGDENGDVLDTSVRFKGEEAIWNHWEFKATIGNSGSWEVRKDGHTVMSGTGDTQVTGNATADRVYIGGDSGSNDSDIYIDDIYVLDGSGSAPTNDFIGERYVESKTAVADGDLSEFSVEAVGSPSAEDNWFAVRQLSYEPGDNLYVVPGAIGSQDLYELNSFETSNGGITGLQFSIRARLEAGGSDDFSAMLGSDALGSFSVTGTSYQNYFVFAELNADSERFSAQALEGQFGIRRDSGSTATRITHIAVEVVCAPPVGGSTFPATPDKQKFFLHDWVSEIEMETSFSSAIAYNPDTGAEERWALLMKPLRTLRVFWSPDVDRGLRDLFADLQRRTSQKMFLPLYQDVVETTGDSAIRNIPCDPSRGRFFEGAKAILIDWEYGNQGTSPDGFQIITISEIRPNEILSVETLTTTPVQGRGLLMPLIVVDPILSASGTMITDQRIEMSLTFDEASDEATLPGTAQGRVGGYSTHEDLMILDLKHNWAVSAGIGLERKGRSFSQGKGQLVVPQATRASWAQNYQALLDRDEAWSLIQFLESRFGRAGTFWAIGHLSMFSLISAASTTLVVSAEGDFDDLDFVSHIGLVMKDGSNFVREIDSTTDNGATWNIELTESFPSGYSTADVEKVSWAAICRSASDSFRETWATAGVCTVAFSVIEALDEKSTEMLDLFAGSTINLVGASPLRLAAPGSTVST